MNLKALAEYVGTSVAMIENSYGRFMSDRGLAPLIDAVEAVSSGTLPNLRLAAAGANEKASGTPRLTKWSQGESNRSRDRAAARATSEVAEKSHDPGGSLGSDPVPKTAPNVPRKGAKTQTGLTSPKWTGNGSQIVCTPACDATTRRDRTREVTPRLSRRFWAPALPGSPDFMSTSTRANCAGSSPTILTQRRRATSSLACGGTRTDRPMRVSEPPGSPRRR